MSRKPETAAAKNAVIVTEDAAARALLGPPPLTSLDDAAAYAQLEAALAEEVKPQGVLDRLLLRDVVNLLWEAQRLRRARAVVLALARRAAITRVLRAPEPSPWLGEEDMRVYEAERSAAAYLRDDPDAVEDVQAALSRLGLDDSAIDATAVQIALDDVERLDRLIFQADQRRDAVLRDLQRSRDARAQALADAALIVDAEYEA